MLFLGMIGTGSWAYFTDSEMSDDNSLQAGTLDLKTDDVDGAYFAEIGRLFGMKAAGCSGKTATPLVAPD